MTSEFKWSSTNVLVTGAAGFIGSHLTERLVASGARPRAFVQYNSRGHRGWLERSTFRNTIDFIVGDIRDPDSVREAMQGVDVVFHLAALIAIPYSYAAPASYVSTNITGTLNVLQAARTNGIKRLVHTSTSEVYGSALTVPIHESHPLQGQSPYAATKIGADKLAEAFHRSFDIPVVTVRPFNTFGPRQSTRAVTASIIIQALAGTSLKLGSLSPTRDLNFVANTVDGFMAAAAADAVLGKTINLGSGREVSIGELVEIIGKLIGTELRVEQDPARLRPAASEVDRLLADNSLAWQLLNWSPTISLEEGLKRTIEWMRQNQHEYRAQVYAI